MTIKDIAALAGVSKATVSRVLNNAENVDENTRQRVLKIMKDNNYVPSAMARRLKKENNVIGLIVPEVDDSFFGKIVQGINDILKKTEYTILLCCTDNNPKDELRALGVLRQQRVSGLFLTTSSDFSSKKEAIKIEAAVKDLNVPVVLIDRVFPNTGWNGVYSDNIYGAYSATCTLIEHGFKKIGAIFSDIKLPLGQERLKGFKTALAEHGCPLNSDYIYADDFSLSSQQVYHYTCRMIQENKLPEAVFLSNCIITNGFFKAILEHNIRPGIDIHCIGFDYSEILDVVNIPYSYLERNLKLIGQTAAELLLEQLGSDPSPVRKALTVPAALRIDPKLAEHH